MTNTQQHLTEIRFTDFPLPEVLQSAIETIGYTYCTPIQAKTLPVILKKQNIIGQANTGTGKTATFLIAVINQLLSHNFSQPNKSLRALILAPTRELAIQIHKECEALTQHCDLKSFVVYGGTNYEKQKNQMKQHFEILIGTTGRVIDFFKQGLIRLNHIEALVLDEADRMLDMGFIKDVRYLIRKLPPADKRLNLLFSATINYRVKEFAYEVMSAPQIITAIQQEEDKKIEQWGYYVANEEKIPLLIGLLHHLAAKRTIVFVNTKASAELVTRSLMGNDIGAELLSGDVPQVRRQKLVEQFAQGKFPVLVATDIAARGLHIEEVSHVINFDLPQDPEDYVHRIGRTGRIGSSGDAISFVCETYAFHLPDIETFTGNTIPIQRTDASLIPQIKPPAPFKQLNIPVNSNKKKSGAKQQDWKKRKKRNQKSENKNSSN